MDVRERARRWMADDPDPGTREELQRLLDLDDLPGLQDRFAGRLQFGTAGLRGPIGAGPNRMNRALVRLVTAGLADRLLEAPGTGHRGIVVGHDARHGSAEFAEDAARVLAGAGLGVWRLSGVVPTPLVAFAVRALDAAGGVMITASHNPPSDNGYKVFGPGGRQIVPPFDEEVSAAIDAVGAVLDIPLAAEGDQLLWRVDPAIIEEYVAAVLELVPDGPRALRIVYTPLHGVAGGMTRRLLTDAGFDDVHVVAEQAEPDPDFPTTPFPNPEEPGTLDQALGLAAGVDADVVLANDPDGDRIAVAVRGAGGHELLDGDEVGSALGHLLLHEPSQAAERVVATTVVSSSLLAKIARAAGAGYAETLTGFKWLAGVASDVTARGGRFVLGYEQALGVSIGDVVRDKDGMSAAVVVAAFAARLAAEGRTLRDVLDDLARAHGVHATRGRNLALDPDSDEVALALQRVVDQPPDTLAGSPVTVVWDHAGGAARHRDGTVTKIELPPTPLVRLDAASGDRVMVRPSGTEPKLKFYAEAVEPVTGEVAAARSAAEARCERLLDEVVTAAGLA